MDLESRLRVYAELSCEIIRNAAYYSAGWEANGKQKREDSDFWRNLIGNFLDIAVLSWCFLYGDKRAKFRWQEIIPDHDKFMELLLLHLKSSFEDFEDYISCMRLYRDKRVAHRDEYLVGDPQIVYPCLDIAIESTMFFYSKLCEEQPMMQEIHAYSELGSFYASRYSMAEAEYEKATS